jgi:hypothetical protein
MSFLPSWTNKLSGCSLSQAISTFFILVRESRGWLTLTGRRAYLVQKNGPLSINILPEAKIQPPWEKIFSINIPSLESTETKSPTRKVSSSNTRLTSVRVTAEAVKSVAIVNTQRQFRKQRATAAATTKQKQQQQQHRHTQREKDSKSKKITKIRFSQE